MLTSRMRLAPLSFGAWARTLTSAGRPDQSGVMSASAREHVLEFADQSDRRARVRGFRQLLEKRDREIVRGTATIGVANKLLASVIGGKLTRQCHHFG